MHAPYSEDSDKLWLTCKAWLTEGQQIPAYAPMRHMSPPILSSPAIRTDLCMRCALGREAHVRKVLGDVPSCTTVAASQVSRTIRDAAGRHPLVN